MATLTAMRAETYGPYLEAEIAGYAHDNVASGRWPEDGALERSRAEFENLLPHGLATPDNYLFELHAPDGGPLVGFVWLAIERKLATTSAFVYDLEVKPEYRRQGHALRALVALEQFAKAQGASSIGLHVFAHNQPAQALYRRLGYQITGFNMLKLLEDDRT